MSEIGTLLKEWRGTRGLSQMALAHRAGISPRHMSFVETGRSRPGREVLVQLFEELEVPFRERNRMLEAAGYARMYRSSSLDDAEVERVAEAFRFILERHEPYPAVVVDAAWEVRMANRVHELLMERLLADAPLSVRRETNLLVQTVDPDGLRPFIRNFDEVAGILVDRLRRQVADATATAAQRALLERVEELGGPFERPAPDPGSLLPVLVPIELEVEDARLRLFTTLTTLGTPQDVLLQELRIESFFPADDATDRALRGMAGA